MAFIFVSTSCNLPNHQDTPPNLVFILTDDLGWSDIGAYGSEVRTPNLDRLAEEGARFIQVYNTSKCFPSRACLLTGQYAQSINYHKNYRNSMNPAVTIGEVLKGAGYRTWWSGKHHSTEHPMDRGFDHYYGLWEGASNHFNPGEQRPGEGPPAQKRPDRPFCVDTTVYQPYTPPKDFYTTDYFTNYALQWLEEGKDATRPFFLYLAYTAPHDPLMAWPEDIARYEGRYDQGYEAIRLARYRKQLESGLIDSTYKLSEATFMPWDSLTPEKQREEARKMEVYAAMIDRVDQNIGRLLRKLDSLGELDHTVICFASDNGASAEVVRLESDSGKIGTLTRWTSLGPDWANVSNTPFRKFKNYSHEGGIRTPLIIWYPKEIAAGSLVHTPAHFIDILPTLAGIARAPYPKKHHSIDVPLPAGINLWPAVKGSALHRDEPLFFDWARERAVITENWKIVQYEDEPWELYDMIHDPTETHNLAAENPEKVTELKAAFGSWKEKVMPD